MFLIGMFSPQRLLGKQTYTCERAHVYSSKNAHVNMHETRWRMAEEEGYKERKRDRSILNNSIN